MSVESPPPAGFQWATFEQDATKVSADVPSIIVGGGRIGSALADLGMEGDVVMRRGDPFPSEPTSGPIYVTTRNNDLAGVIEATPRYSTSSAPSPSPPQSEGRRWRSEPLAEWCGLPFRRRVRAST